MEQLGLSPFTAGDLVQWWDARGRRTGRFVGVVVGGALVEERIVRVPVVDLAVAGSGRGRVRA